MTPIDPVEVVPTHARQPMAPPFVDENDPLELVREGLDTAENELRDAVTDEYEKEAVADDDAEEFLDDIDHDDGFDGDQSPEMSALHTLREGEDLEAGDDS